MFQLSPALRHILYAGLLLTTSALFADSSYADSASADDGTKDLIQDGDTIVFFGDSITQGGMYIDHIEAWLLCRYPNYRLRVLNRGISSETISGTSEADHDPRRPWAHERFTRDITPLQPQVLVACFGMNDGNYHSFDWPRFEKYQQGIRRLIQRACEEAGVRTLILMTPPPYDPYQRKPGDIQAKEYGYKFAAIDYDQTLGRYSDWLLSLRSEGIPVIDLHGSLNQHLRARRQQQVSFFLAGDAVHPNMTGHWLMALQFLRQARLAPPRELTMMPEAVGPMGWEGTISIHGLAPIDADVSSPSVELELGRGQEFAWQQLGWTQVLPANQTFEVLLDGHKIGEIGDRDNVIQRTVPVQGPQTTLSARQDLMKKVRERRQLEYWQYRSHTDKPLGKTPPVTDIPARLEELTQEINTLRQPFDVKVTVRPLITTAGTAAKTSQP